MKKFFLFALTAFFSIFSLLTTNNKLKIAIVGVHDKNYHHIGQYAHLNKQMYAKKHGYNAILYVENLVTDPTKSAHWNKIIAIQKHLDDYDWIFWGDSDALIMNYNIKLEDFIDDKYDLIISRDCLDNINTGHFFIKNSQWSKQFLKDWYSADIIGKDLKAIADNGAFIMLMENSESVRKKIKVITAKALNSYLVCPLWYIVHGQYAIGDFILHFVGRSYEERAKLIAEYYHKIVNKN